MRFAGRVLIYAMACTWPKAWGVHFSRNSSQTPILTSVLKCPERARDDKKERKAEVRA